MTSPAELRPDQQDVAVTGTVDWSRVQRWGLYGGITMTFVAAAGMVTSLDRRLIVDPWLSLGFLLLLWVPVVFGNIAARDEEADGGVPTEPGEHNLLAGTVTGVLSGLFFSFFFVIADAVDLTGVLRNATPALVDLVTFGRGLGVAALLWILGGGLLGLLGGAMHVMPRQLTRWLSGGALSVVAVALMELVITDLAQGLRAEFLADWIYAPRSGVRTVPALLIFLIGGAVATSRGDKTLQERRLERMALPPDERFRKNAIAAAVTVLAVIFVPMVLGGLSNELLAQVGLFILMALGLNIVVGSAGLLDLGYVAFFAVGAYTTAVLTSPQSPTWKPELTLDFLSWEGWLIMAIIIVMSAIAGILVGTPVIRLRGDYLAIVTLGFGEIIRVLFLSDWLAPYFGGAQGVTNVPSAELGAIELPGTNSQVMFYLISVFVGLAIYVSWRLQRSRTGRAWTALREDEDVAEAMGVNTTAAKLTAFVTGAILAGLAGMLFAVKVGSIFPTSFRLLVSIIILAIVIVGGMGSIPGVIIGAAVLIGVLGGPTQPGLLQEFGEFKMLVSTALLVFMMLKRPEGLWPSLRRQRELHQDEMSQDAWLTGSPGARDDDEEDDD